MRMRFELASIMAALVMMTVTSVSVFGQQWGGSATLDGDLYRKGNIGIGTNTPTVRLHITRLGVSDGIILEGSSSTEDVRLSLDNNLTGGRKYLLGSSSLTSYGDGLFIIRDGDLGVDRFLIDANGNTGIAALDAATRLTVNSAAGDHGLQVQIDGDTKMFVTSNGGVSIGSGSTDNPDDGLYVSGQSLVGVEVDGILYVPEAKMQVSGGLSEIGGHFKTHGDAGPAYGLMGEADGYTFNVGVYAFADGLTTNYSFYADQSSFGTAYAGYFDGDIYVTGSYLPSDEQLKEDVVDLDGALDKVMALQPREYQYKHAEHDYMSLPEGTRYGFVAQELETVFPELTKTTLQPTESPEELAKSGNAPELLEFKAVDYVSLVPVLVAAVQEQQVLIQQLVASLRENGIELNLSLPQAMQDGAAPGLQVTGETAASTVESLPMRYSLEQNYPNPFNPQTAIKYTMPKDGHVSIKVYNMLGEEVRTLVNGYETAGYKLAIWDGASNSGTRVASGTYVYTMTADGYTATNKMVLVR